MNHNPEDFFELCVERKERKERKELKDGCLSIRCVFGLWSVTGFDRPFVESNARHYWMQYLEDGEYAKLLSSDAPLRKA